MVTICWSVKGGSGTTVVAAMLALSSPRPTLLVDLDGELPRVLGLDVRDRPGVADWCESDAPPAHLADLLIEVDRSTRLLPWRSHGRGPVPRPPSVDRFDELVTWFRDRSTEDGPVVIDAGTGEPPRRLADAAHARLIVMRPCYLAASRLRDVDAEPTGLVLVEESGRSLRRQDIEASAAVPIVARVPWDPAVARAVDAGLVRTRLPRAVGRELRRVA